MFNCCHRPTTHSGRPITGFVRPSTQSGRPGTMEQAIKTPRTAHTARPVTSASGRFVRLGTVPVHSCLDYAFTTTIIQWIAMTWPRVDHNNFMPFTMNASHHSRTKILLKCVCQLTDTGSLSGVLSASSDTVFSLWLCFFFTEEDACCTVSTAYIQWLWWEMDVPYLVPQFLFSQASMLTNPEGPFINLSRLNLAKYAQKPNLSKVLADFQWMCKAD